jgi:hypothetical protein
MNNEGWAHLLKYSTPDSIWVITWESKLLELKCPFTVLVKYDVGDLLRGCKIYVEKVKISSSMITVFIIQNKAYYYNHFEIIVD